MIYPQFDHIVTLARDYNVIPVCQTFLADTETPIGLLQKNKQNDHAFLLESVEGAARWARYSFVGSDPFLIFAARDGEMRIQQRNGTTEIRTGNPLESLEELVSEYRCPKYEGYPPFLGGCVGSLGYEMIQYIERIPTADSDPLQSQDLHFMFYDRLCVFDHLKQQVIAVQLIHVPEQDPDIELLRERYDAAKKQLSAWIAFLQSNESTRMVTPAVQDVEANVSLKYRSNMTKDAFMRQVAKAQEAIRAGDVQQVVLSQRLEVDVTIDPFDVYRVLRTLNPSPYMYYLQMGEETIVGASPEVLVKVQDGQVETRPIAGTRKRGNTVEEDQCLAEELLNDDKERAEHEMLVDLGKEELGRVCEPGTVELKQFMEVEYYSHVMHIVSHVIGQLRSPYSPFQALTACFPAGTVSGAPKRHAMEMIAALEGERRGIYAGGIGYMAFSGNVDTCIAIRTIVFKQGKAYIQAGAGIVADSVPENEYDESLNKARALLTALARAQILFQPTVQRS